MSSVECRTPWQEVPPMSQQPGIEDGHGTSWARVGLSKLGVWLAQKILRGSIRESQSPGGQLKPLVVAASPAEFC